jgi:hypothetical protein
MEAHNASMPRSLQYKEFDRLYRKEKLAFEDRVTIKAAPVAASCPNYGHDVRAI